MATFEIEANGKVFEVEAPDMQAAVAALNGYQSQQAPAQPQTPDSLQAAPAPHVAPEPIPAPEAPTRGIGQRLYDNIIGDPTDGVQSTGEALGTWLNRGVESATLGAVGDEANAAVSGMLPGRSYESELERYRANEAGMSTAGKLSADLSGALVPGFGMASGVKSGASLLTKMLRGAGVGAVSGASYGFMEGEGEDDRLADMGMGAGFGALLGGIIPAAGAGVRSIVSGRASRNAVADAGRNAPTSEELREMGTRLYQKVDDARVQIKPESFNREKDDIRDYLRKNTSFDEHAGPGSLTPKSARVMDVMDADSAAMSAEPTAALPFSSLDQLRRKAGAAAGNVTDKADQQAGTAIIEQLDDYVGRLGPDDLVGGDPDALRAAIGQARDTWGRMSRSQMIDDAIEQSDNYMSGGSSGVRNQLAKILRNPKKMRGFSEVERQAMRAALKGSSVEQAINLAGGGIGRIAQATAGAGIGGPAGFAAGLVGGQVSRNVSEAMARKSIERVRAAIASGALRDPEVARKLLEAGDRPELLTNAGLFSALSAGQ